MNDAQGLSVSLVKLRDFANENSELLDTIITSSLKNEMSKFEEISLDRRIVTLQFYTYLFEMLKEKAT